jgi:hypothetical protein
LITACIAQLEAWDVTRQDAGGELPVHGVYGVPEQWPHVRALYQEAGFSHIGHTEIVYLARVDDLPRPASPPLAEPSVRRSVGINGCRLSATETRTQRGWTGLSPRTHSREPRRTW